ncbi:MFS transporter (macronuclear) [Tetrahymena thermophila SB210]|uniref:MFS transporter n=1 Tax=Tetrahymena thermophila (strain SB210) TaxID=312017 RepID=W7XEF4_TETTS|nr:MFS transporter [Tetrahymena thermophila SB210]EWS75008.1 MFS transporter [Tetrahymena thermophila SB210]|eukprot:XP_012652466.1 MFS transporter [Tetrahymena thermophila SB210]
MGSGVFTLVWPTTKLIGIKNYLQQQLILSINNLQFTQINQNQLVVDTGTSQAVPHLSTNPALRRLTSEFEWDPVFSPQYGRQQNYYQQITIYNNNIQFAFSLNNLQFTQTNQYQKKQYFLNYQKLFQLKQKGCRHWDFPSGPPPQYQPSLKALNFGVRMGSGVFTLVWPTTKLISINNYLQQQLLICFITQQSTIYLNKFIWQKQYSQMVKNYVNQNKKVVDTGTSQAVPHLSTNPALRRLTSEFEWDPVFSPQYGRQQNYYQQITIYNNNIQFAFLLNNLQFTQTNQYQKKQYFLNYQKLFQLKQKGCRHWDFPSGPPPQYQPSLKALNFGVRMGSGVFTLVWPTTKLIAINNYLYQIYFYKITLFYFKIYSINQNQKDNYFLK